MDLQTNLSVKYDDLPLETRDGSRINVEFVSNVYDEGEKKVIQCNIRNITTRKTAENKLQYFSTHDSLTKIYNRSFFEEELNRLEHSRQFPISIIMLDVDGLKIINDNQGHAVGDEILFRLAKILVKSFRSEDIVARIGGGMNSLSCYPFRMKWLFRKASRELHRTWKSPIKIVPIFR